MTATNNMATTTVSRPEGLVAQLAYLTRVLRVPTVDDADPEQQAQAAPTVGAIGGVLTASSYRSQI